MIMDEPVMKRRYAGAKPYVVGSSSIHFKIWISKYQNTTHANFLMILAVHK